MAEPRDLTPGREAWLREHIPVWGALRDQAIAAGLIEPNRSKKEQVQAISKRVRNRLNKE